MRRLLTSFVVAAIAAVVPTLALADNQEIAEQIAGKLRSSGQMSDYRIGVKYQEGTVWLRGQVANEEQMNTAVKLVFQLPGVENVVNELKVTTQEGSQAADDEQIKGGESDSTPASKAGKSIDNPLRAGKETNSLAKRPHFNLMKHMGLFNSKKAVAETPKPQAIREEIEEMPPQADRVPSDYSSESIKQTSAQEYQEAPQQMAAPQNAKPMASRGVARMAMMQSGTRGPTAPTGSPLPMYSAGANPSGAAPARYDQPCMPNYAWPSYAAYPNYAAVTYPKQYSPTAWPYIGPFYPYPQVPLGWRKVTLEWDSGWWFLDFKDQPASCWHR
jgi:hypothetical protein